MAIGLALKTNPEIDVYNTSRSKRDMAQDVTVDRSLSIIIVVPGDVARRHS
jgi:hypothetical protein